MSPRDFDVAIIGGGAAGVIVALHLLSAPSAPARVALVESSGSLCSGPAYSAQDSNYLLNARCGEMSAWQDNPSDFTDFARQSDVNYGANSFVPRHVYRDYLQTRLAQLRARRAKDVRVTVIHDHAMEICPSAGRRPSTSLNVLVSGGVIRADQVVLAIGAPASIPPWEELETVEPGTDLIRDPWAPNALSNIECSEHVVLLGSGLTMCDVAVGLRASRQTHQIRVRSRRGLLPLHHLEWPSPPAEICFAASPRSARELVHAVREATKKAEAEGRDWRSVVSAVRTQLPSLWDQMPEPEKAALLTHARPYWEIHRHRMPPSVHEQLQQMLNCGELEIGAGRLTAIHRVSDGQFELSFAHAGASETLRADAVVNCTGPNRDYLKTSPLIRQLLNSGLALQDPTGYGLLLDASGDLYAEDGQVNHQLHTVGWLRFGQRYETTAIPEIRAQAELLTSRLQGALAA
jgi:uncharacterized NAD(P)/FAD-binding protein YdhS